MAKEATTKTRKDEGTKKRYALLSKEEMPDIDVRAILKDSSGHPFEGLFVLSDFRAFVVPAFFSYCSF
ncbi:MAG: hypothetical protein MUO52_17395 [Desulfobacterales bacterium]|nr:hypothetical protein [Desulfobacterales bacterium]